METFKKIRVFITADALLAAILMVWAQLWIQPSIRFWSSNSNSTASGVEGWFTTYNDSASFGLLLTYPAILLTLVALALTTWVSFKDSDDETPTIAIGLFGSALFLAIFNVGQSIVNVLIKFVHRQLIYEPFPLSDYPTDFWIIFWITFTITVILFGIFFTSPGNKILQNILSISRNYLIMFWAYLILHTLIIRT